MKLKRISEHDRVNIHRYRAAKCGASATLTLSEWERTISDFHGLCAYGLLKPYDLLEHFIPVEIGGTHVKNCIPACNDCNMKKGNRTADALIQVFGRETITRIAICFLESAGCCF